ncbi:MAG TPA: hypothetical protein VK203_26625, partial [Nostocaceae cyanobacterium]|nr:hypothetical protein [Nostocaceae cyanobacterium]
RGRGERRIKNSPLSLHRVSPLFISPSPHLPISPSPSPLSLPGANFAISLISKLIWIKVRSSRWYKYRKDVTQ